MEKAISPLEFDRSASTACTRKTAVPGGVDSEIVSSYDETSNIGELSFISRTEM